MAIGTSSHLEIVRPGLGLPKNDELDCYGVLVAIPAARLNRENRSALYTRFSDERQLLPPSFSLESAAKYVRRYNGHAAGLKWRTWAVPIVDLRLREFLSRVKAAGLQLTDTRTGSLGLDPRLQVYGRDWDEKAFYTHALLEITFETPIDSSDDLRQVALRELRKAIERLEGGDGGKRTRIANPVARRIRAAQRLIRPRLAC